MTKKTQAIADRIADIAAELAACEELEPRDRNMVIGRLRDVAGFIIGAPALPPYKQAPHAAMGKGSPAPEPENEVPNVPPRTVA